MIANPDDCHKLGDQLSDRRVYDPKRRFILISNELYTIVNEDAPWLKNEEDDVSVTGNKTKVKTVEINVNTTIYDSGLKRRCF